MPTHEIGVMPTKPHQSLTIAIVNDLATCLVEVSDRNPIALRTERDFFPLVETFLAGRVPNVTREVGDSNEKIDFRVGGPNPGLLELAVAPREFKDAENPLVEFAGHKQFPQLFPSTNESEVKKLGAAKVAKNRFLLLLDLGRKSNFLKLKESYQKKWPNDGAIRPIQVIVARSDSTPQRFQIGGGKKKSSRK